MQEEVEEIEAEDGDRFTLGDLWAILRMQKWVIIAALILCVSASAIYTSMATRYYTAKATVHITTQRSREMDMGDEISDGMNVWTRPTYLKTRLAILNSSTSKRRVLSRYEELGFDDGVKADGAGVALLSRSVKYIPRAGTELVDIVATTTDPELSARLANLMAQVLRDDSLESATAAAMSANEWLATQLEENDEKIAEASRALTMYKRDNDMADVEQGSTALTARLDSLKTAFGDANTARVQHESQLRMHEAFLRNGDYDALQRSVADPTISELVSQYAAAVSAFQTAKKVYGPRMPHYKEAERAIPDVEGVLKSEIQRTLEGDRATLEVYRARENELKAAIDAAKDELLDVSSRVYEYQKRKLDLEIATNESRALKQRRAELEMQAKTQLNNVRLIEEARPRTSPTSPNVGQNLMLGFAGGLFLGIGGAFIREWMDDTVSSPLDVTTYLRVRLLGIIPKVHDVEEEKDRSLFTAQNPNSNIAEAIRGIRTVIELSPTGESPRRLMVTSALSSEGKTSTTLRLAIAFASLDRKVIVVDADMRRPRVHRVFEGERVPGLATCLLQDATVDEAIRPSGVPNLFYMSAGKAYDRPNELLTSEAFAQLLRELDQRFDMVFVDTPPSVILSDARLISRHMEAVLVVVKERATSRFVIREAIRGLEQVGANVLGAVVNGVDFSRRKAYSYYGYGYGYGYGQGYTYGQDLEDDDHTESASG